MTKHLKLKFAVIAMFGFLMSCSDLASADKIVEGANRKAGEANSLYFKTETRTKEVLSPKGNTTEELMAYKGKVLDEARSIAGDYQKVSGMLKDVATQFEAVSQMNVNNEHKEFAKAKADEYNKRSQAVAVIKDGVQAFIDADDFNKLHVQLAEYQEKQHQLFKDAQDSESKANMIRHKSEPLITWE